MALKLKESDVRPFPVYNRGETPGFIPWWLAEIAYKAYVKKYGSMTSLEHIAKQGGFERKELVDLLRSVERRKNKR